MQQHVYRGPRIPVATPPAGHRNSCPFCYHPGYRAPGPCGKCGTTGYATGTPPGFRGIPWYLQQPECLPPELEADKVCDGDCDIVNLLFSKVGDNLSG